MIDPSKHPAAVLERLRLRADADRTLSAIDKQLVDMGKPEQARVSSKIIRDFVMDLLKEPK